MMLPDFALKKKRNNRRAKRVLKTPQHPFQFSLGADWDISATLWNGGVQKAKAGVLTKPGNTAALASNTDRPPKSSPLLK